MSVLTSKLGRWSRHVICVLALMWTGLANGQAFFFPSDSTNYVRAADMAVYLASGKTFSTAWTERHRASVEKSSVKVAPKSSVNDLSSGLIMSGRSPYIGALMYAGYVISNFWAFIIFQAAVAYGLIVLVLKRLNVVSHQAVAGVTILLAATTALPTYNSLLLADAFSSFGILAFVLLATPGTHSRLESLFLTSVLAIFAVAHLTHIWMLAAMLLVLGAIRLSGTAVPRRAWVAGVAMILVGLISVQATSIVVKHAFGKEPQLLPLLSARFIADGPGKAFIDSGCDGRKFQICRIHIGEPRSNPLILFGMERSNGAYMLVGPEERRRMGQEDTAFALAVFRFDPVGQSLAVVKNSVRQLLWIDYDGLNQGCWNEPNCWDKLPGPVRATLRESLSGQNAWPQQAMNWLLYAVVIVSLIAIPVAYTRLKAEDATQASIVLRWILIGSVAILISSILGGAVAEPQYRYQGRLVWLIPLTAAALTGAIFRYRGTAALREQPV